MDLNKCTLLTTVEFGSTYQGTADEYSDRDLMVIVRQPLEDVIFRNHEKAAVHKNEARYYSVERFIRLIEKGGFDNILLLCAQLEQAEGTRFNQKVLKDFYDPYVFRCFVMANMKTLVFSVIGQINGLLKNKETLTGKELVKLYTFLHHLESYSDILTAEKEIDYRTFSKVTDMDEGLLEDKRHKETHITEWHLDKIRKLVEDSAQKFRVIIGDTDFGEYRKVADATMKNVKSNAVEFLIN